MLVSTRDQLSVQMMAVFERDFPPGLLPFVRKLASSWELFLFRSVIVFGCENDASVSRGWICLFFMGGFQALRIAAVSANCSRATHFAAVCVTQRIASLCFISLPMLR